LWCLTIIYIYFIYFLQWTILIGPQNKSFYICNFLYILPQTKRRLLFYTLVLTRHRKWSHMQSLSLLVSLQVILQEWDFTIPRLKIKSLIPTYTWRSIPFLRRRCKNHPSPMPHDLHMFRFMITFALSFMIQAKPQIENIPKICGRIHISPCPMPFILKFTLHFHLKTNDTNSKQNNLNFIFKTMDAHL